MARYLDPKADVSFKKVFGEHPLILKSFLNAVLPLVDREIVELTYLSNENAPQTPALKRTIADVRCVDNKGRVFIVEMQVEWADSFKQRLLFEGCQAFVKQLKRGDDYSLIQPVYALGLIASNFDPSDVWYHHYQLTNKNTEPASVIEHLQLVFIELLKFPVESPTEKKLRLLWLRFLREVGQENQVISPEFSEVPEMGEALNLLEESAYSEAELVSYRHYWDSVSREATLIKDRYEKGLEQGLEQGREAEKHHIAIQMLRAGMDLALIQQCTGLSEAFIKTLTVLNEAKAQATS